MGFQDGNITFSRCRVHGLKTNSTPDQETLDKLTGFVFSPTTDGVPPDVEYGWSGGRHIMDNEFSFENNVFGDAILFGVRIDTHRVPADVKKAYLATAIAALTKDNPSGFASKIQKRQAKEQVQSQIDEEKKTGKYRRSKVVPVLWNVATGYVYSPATGTARAQLCELFNRTFNGELWTTSAGNLAEDNGLDMSLLKPTQFALTSDGEEVTYPWASKGITSYDFLGNEFLLWIMHEIASGNGSIKTLKEDGPYAIVDLIIDRSLSLDCAQGTSGKDSFTASGPDRLPEVLEAIRHGKVPRRAGLVFSVAGDQYTFNFNPESFTYGGTKLPEVKDADTARTLTEARVDLLDTMCTAMEELYKTFLRDRGSSEIWDNVTNAISDWLSGNEDAEEIAATAAESTEGN